MFARFISKKMPIHFPPRFAENFAGKMKDFQRKNAKNSVLTPTPPVGQQEAKNSQPTT